MNTINDGLKSLLGWVDARFPLTSNWRYHVSEYYAPKNFNFWYFFGSLAMLVLVIQIVTGIFLVMHFKPDATLNASGVPIANHDLGIAEIHVGRDFEIVRSRLVLVNTTGQIKGRTVART